ncbi:hypothetical protein MYX82_04025 [Acidobacteria bacterium AH-259-D05]|nr:hypothetical protein [Acidobacteria bacterium AH-259-D05]
MMEDLKGIKSKVFKVRNGDTIRPLTSTTETRDLTNSEQVIVLDSCRCGAILHTPKEVAATCVGGESLCAECSKTRCEECNKIMCPDHAKEWGEKKVCINHGFPGWVFVVIVLIVVLFVLCSSPN